jgi:hypothetical protein
MQRPTVLRVSKSRISTEMMISWLQAESVAPICPVAFVLVNYYLIIHQYKINLIAVVIFWYIFILWWSHFQIL